MALETEIQNGPGMGKDTSTTFKEGMEATELKKGPVKSEKLTGK